MKDDIIQYIIENYTNEEGVRSLKRCLESIISKINTLSLLDNNSNINQIVSYHFKEFKLPLELSINIINKLLKNTEKEKASYKMMYL